MAKQTNRSLYLILLFPLAMFCLVGTIIGATNGNPMAGFLWGLGIGLGVIAVTFIGMNGWEWLQGEMSKGKLFPYISVGIIIAAAFAGYLAFTLGNASCEEYDSAEPRSSCIQYADDGYKATDEQRWEKFWSTFPVAAIIASLIATIVHHNIHKGSKNGKE